MQSSSPVLNATVGCSAYESGSNRCQVDVQVEHAVKNCLSAMWKLRESVIGDLGVVARRLVVSPLDLR